MSSAQIVSASVLQNTASARMFGTPGIAGNAVPMHTMLNSPGGPQQQGNSPVVVKHEILNPTTGLVRKIVLMMLASCVIFYRSGLLIWGQCLLAPLCLAAW